MNKQKIIAALSQGSATLERMLKEKGDCDLKAGICYCAEKRTVEIMKAAINEIENEEGN